MDHFRARQLPGVDLRSGMPRNPARERKAFDFDAVCQRLVDKLIRRHPHVFGDSNAKTVDAVWAQWEQIKKAEKHGTKHHRASVFDGIPRHLPALLRAEKLVKKARKAKLLGAASRRRAQKKKIAENLFDLASTAQGQGWSAEALLRAEVQRREKAFRKKENSA